MPDYGKQVKQVAYPPSRHPMSGRVINLQQVVIDRIVTKEQADKLNRHYNRKAAQGSLPMGES